ncbi:MAG: T9SS type A sorting domain-containing protein [Crocinitomicaceae bacterium]|nr:T9SS type A sorting domain-containing protein [Crocinitomicaceae bacterium]
MKLNFKTFGILALTAGTGIYFLADSEEQQQLNPNQGDSKQIPIPATVYEHMQDEKEFGERKRNYFDHIHGNYPNWREINQANFNSIYEQRALQRSMKIPEVFADGALSGEWVERGSNDQAGNVQISDYHISTGNVYAISDGGTLWKGDLNDGAWTPMNEDIQFGSRVLKVFDLPGGGTRILAVRGHGVFYSDDDGASWTQSTGFTSDWDYGAGIDLARLNDAQNTLVYVYLAYDFGLSSYENRLAYSVNDGTSWTVVTDFNTYSSHFISMDVPYNSATAYIVNGADETYIFESGSLTQISSSPGLSGTESCYLATNMTSTDTTLWVLMDNHDLYKSTDGGANYTYISTTPVDSWDAGIEVSIDDPDILYLGEMELYQSTDGGLNFNLVNNWWEYYGDVAGKIHADIMSITSFKNSGGQEFTLIPNHGGISVSYDNLATTENIGMLNLNVGQFYDVITSPVNSNFVFGGTQDQGYQRSTTGNSMSSSSFDQVISGDYGQMQFSNNGQGIWIQYPGADFSYYSSAMTDNWSDFSYNLEGSDMPNYDWIVPTSPAPDADDDYILVGGGEITGGAGSYLIKVENVGLNAIPTQYDYDFSAASGGGLISAIGVTPFDQDKWYVATDNGKFFHSEDAGTNWTETASFNGPEGDWIYGACIYASRKTDGLVFVGGAGYSVDAVFMSTDGGVTFNGIWSSPLPETAVHEMVMDPMEQFLFAATDAGPYVYVVAEGEWYSLLGLSAPVQEYMCVEYVEAEHIVRFGTWGRGIWDLFLPYEAGIKPADELAMFSIYPNPSIDGKVTIETDQPAVLVIVDETGRKVFNTPLTQDINHVDLSSLPKGVYISAIISADGKINRAKWIRQ